MKLEDRDRLNNIRGIAHSIDVITDQDEINDLAREMIDGYRPHLGQRQTVHVRGGGK